MQLVSRFLDLGARTFVLRMGAAGSLLASRTSREVIHVPAAPADVVDVTGCGNAFNGGFLAKLAEGAGLRTAGVWGSVAASLMAEAEGAPDLRCFHNERI